MNLRKACPSLGLVTRVAVAVSVIGFTGCAFGGDVDTLYRAAGGGDTSRVLALLESGVDVNARTSDNSYALNRAAVYQQTEMVRLLLEHGADPNLQNAEGDTPLICATKYAGGHAPTVKLLVEGGTDPMIKDNDGKTALDYAKALGQQEAIALLERSDS